jgi:hypothetical protein
MRLAKRRDGLKPLFLSMSKDVQGYFSDLPALADSRFGSDVILAYAFLRLEQGQYQTLYCAARKLHKTETDLTKRALDRQHMTRGSYLEFFNTILGFPVDKDVQGIIEAAEQIRDRVIHGKRVSEVEKLEAISRVLHYSDRMNELIAVHKKLRFRPFSRNIRGFSGRLRSLDKATTRWILKGMGFTNVG